MREDMARVIVERPRIRPRNGERKGRTQALEDLPSHEGMRRPHRLSGRWKTLNETLNPLCRFLERQVGRPWNKVYAEIAERLRVDSTVQQHVRDHVGDFVAVDPRLRAGWAFTPGVGMERAPCLWYQPLYVDPRDGILKRSANHPFAKAERRAAARESAAPSDRVALAHGRELRRINGIWYEVRLAPLPEPVGIAHSAADHVYIAEKRQLCRAELRQHGLENEAGGW